MKTKRVKVVRVRVKRAVHGAGSDRCPKCGYQYWDCRCEWR